MIINTLSMIADDYKDSLASATKLYEILRHRLLGCKVAEKLPVIYVLDSILKNCKGCYVTIVERDASSSSSCGVGGGGGDTKTTATTPVAPFWMATVHHQLASQPPQQAKLQKVWRTWNEFRLFSDVAVWKAMGRCFTEAPNSAVALQTPQFPAVAGISRTVRSLSLRSLSMRSFVHCMCAGGWVFCFVHVTMVLSVRTTDHCYFILYTGIVLCAS